MNQDYTNWATSPNRRMDWEYSMGMWAADVLKAVSQGKPVDARIVAQARVIVDGHPHLDGMRSLLHALNNVAHSRMVAEERIVEKYTTRYTVIDFRLRGWHEAQRVREAHLLLESDIKLTVMELKRGA